MSFVIAGGERFALEMGETILGGPGEGALEIPLLADLPPFAVITYPLEGPSSIRSLGSLPVLLDGVPLGRGSMPLRHGQRLEVAGRVIAYGEMRTAGRTAMAVRADVEAPPYAALQGATSVPTAATGGRLRRLSDRSMFEIPDTGLTIGREPSSGIVLQSKDVSRTHATVAPSLLGYRLTDRSANGVWVNGARIDSSCVLSQHDVIRIGTEEFRFEADAASFEVAPPAEDGPSPAPPVHAARRTGPAPLLASLEVLSEGPLQGVRYRIERPTAQIGRGRANDVRLDNESVSGSHASIVLSGGSWTILDLGSRNGSYVDGEIVRVQRELPRVCELQLGAVKLTFRAISAPRDDQAGTVGVFGITDERARTPP